MVFVKDSPLLVYPIVLEELGLKEYQRITEEQMWKCIEGDAAALVTKIEAKRALGKDVPDTSALKQQLERFRLSR